MKRIFRIQKYHMIPLHKIAGAKFFTKWLADMAADQHEDGYVGHVIPDLLQAPAASAAWGDAAAICPWEVYRAYGNPAILENQFECMHKWVDYITAATTTPNL